MSTALPYNPSASPNWNPKLPFELVIAYQDAPRRERAERLYERLCEQLQTEYEFQSGWWRLHEFTDSRVREQAADAAVRADMVILSLSLNQELPPETNTWIESWLARKDERNTALATLVHPRPVSLGAVVPVRNYLQMVARLGHMDFFFHSAEITPDLPYSIHALRTRAEAMTTVLSETLAPKSPVARWGLNE